MLVDSDGDGPPRFCSVVLGDVVVGVCFALRLLVGDVVVGACFAFSVLVGGVCFAFAGAPVPIAVDPLLACGSEVPPAPGKAFCLGMVDP